MNLEGSWVFKILRRVCLDGAQMTSVIKPGSIIPKPDQDTRLIGNTVTSKLPEICVEPGLGFWFPCLKRI